MLKGEASSEEPVIVLFVGMTACQFSGMLAFKSTSVTRWYINIPIDEIETIRESTKALPHRIERHGSGQNRHEPTETTIAEIAQLEPIDIMGERYKMKIHITEVVSYCSHSASMQQARSSLCQHPGHSAVQTSLQKQCSASTPSM